MRNCRKILILCLILLSLNTITVYANSTSYEVDVVNKVSVGDINISISQNDRGNTIVLPNQIIDRSIGIRNNANPAWIRIKIEYTGSNKIKNLSESMIILSSNEWIKCGQYYYYITPVKKNSYIDFCNSIVIPEDWDSSFSDERFSIIITAEAVQERNFTPDFKSTDPWFGTVVETCVHSTYNKLGVTSGQSFQVLFEDGTQGLVKIGDDFFSNFDNLMPGDSVTDRVKVVNNYSKSVELFFRTDFLTDSILLGAVGLTISIDNKVLYSGNLDAVALRNGVSLGKYSKGSSADLIYILTIPSEMGNEYAQSETSIRWIFSTTLSKAVEPTKGGKDNDKEESTTVALKETESSVVVLGTESVTEDLIKIPDDLIELIKELNDERLNFYLDKEYLTPEEFSELLRLIEELGIPVSEWLPLLPKMGDDFKNEVYIVVMIISLVLLFGLIVLSRKNKGINKT